MYDRAARLLTCSSTSTPSNIGPGTYNFHKHKSKEPKENYAPFHSMDPRESFLTIGESVAAAPGPGHYTDVIGRDKAKGGACDRSVRFVPIKSVTPGPGAYSMDLKWIKGYQPAGQKQIRRTKSMNHIDYQEHAKTPSIPAFGKNYGFEEDDYGNLKPQESPNYDRTLGPAFYKVSCDDCSVSQKYKGIHFGQLTSNRTVFKEYHDGPGPAAYHAMPQDNASSTIAMAVKPSRQSNIPRYHEYVQKLEMVKGVPGPGQYHMKSQFEPTDDDDNHAPMIPFGSSVERFGTKKVESPACTLYTDPRTAFESINRVSGMKHTPFSQSSKRFKTDREAALKPGPGAYEDEYSSSMVVEMMKKMMNAPPKKAFGTTGIRTVPLTRRDDYLIPGPGAYEDTNAKAASDPAKPSYSFPISSKRFPYLPDVVTNTPSPATYEVSESFNKSHGKGYTRSRHTGFLSQPNRFGGPIKFLDESTRENPGPGEYDGTLPRLTHYSGLLCGRDKRFKSRKTTNPGPGAYSMPTEVAETALKGTFNATLNNPFKKKTTYTTQRV